jgi:predicted RNA binding protein YcfA (HicA-like mRNA interferase family)
VPTLHVRDVEKALKAHGFVQRDRGDRIFVLWVNGKKQPIVTKTSQGAKEIWGGRINDMAGQVGLTKAEFLSFVYGEMDLPQYLAILRGKGLI